MLNKSINVVLHILVKRLFREEVRIGGLKAVRAYVQGVGYVRMASIGVIGLIAFVSLVMTGLVLAIGGTMWLMNATAEAMAWTALVSGVILLIAGISVMVVLLNQKRWLDMSRAYDLMDAVVEPVPETSDVPKNIVRAFKGEPMAHAPRSTIEPKVVATPAGPLQYT